MKWVYPGAMWGAVRQRLGIQALGGAEAGKFADACVLDIAGRFKTKGTVDANIITRAQVDIPHNRHYDGGYQVGRNEVFFTSTVTFEAADFSAHPGKDMMMTLWLVPADSFAPGLKPDSGDMILNPDVMVYPAVGYEDELGGVVGPGPVESVGFTNTIPFADLEPNTKYWVMYAPTAINHSGPTTPYGGTPVAPLNVNPRIISFWSNRTPAAPVITSPESGTIATPGETITMTFQPKDPDRLPDAPGDQRNWSFADLAGFQIQYRARPSSLEPDPEWADLPIATLSGTVYAGKGWWIENADDNIEIEVGDAIIPNDGGQAVRDTRSLKILCGDDALIAGQANLDDGEWQLRVRTFDYGHCQNTADYVNPSFPYNEYAVPGYGPLGTLLPDSPPRVSGDGPFPDTDYTPDTYPEINTSPWSEPTNIAIAAQVPVPIPTSPINSVAIEEGEPVTLRWLFRNNFYPPYPQREREVQIRRFGEVDWTTLVSGIQNDEFYSIDDPEGNEEDPEVPTEEPPYEYQGESGSGFEDERINGWENNLPGTLAITDLYNGSITTIEAHTGDYFLTIDYGPSSNVNGNTMRKRCLLRPQDRYFSVSAWGATAETTQRMTMAVWFLNDAWTPIKLHNVPLITTANPEVWTYGELLNVERPYGATQVWVSFYDPTYPVVTNATGMSVDDVVILGSPRTPVGPPDEPFEPPHLLPEVEPIEYTLEATTLYEWRVRVSDGGYIVSDWSDIARFYVVPAAVSGNVNPVPENTIDGATLGCGTHRVEVFRRGGLRRVGEITQLASVEWNRLRDDISHAKIVVKGWDVDCGELLSELQTWAYEIVITRDNGYSQDRVWEGPITLLTYERDQVTIDAKDVMAYAFRRIIRQEMNDASGTGFASDPTSTINVGSTVTARAARVMQNVFAEDDPNILQYLTVIGHEEDGKQYRNLPPYSRTAYEEIDDMASNSGLDYVAVGRAVILWGTKFRIGTLPEFRDENFGASPIVSEYGMSFANRYVVSDGSGVWGEANRLDEFGQDEVYGLVEHLSSTWATDTEEETGTYTEAGRAKAVASFERFAESSITHRYPPPVVVRVPDNTSLTPETVISIQQLVPGVAIPLRSGNTLRPVRAIQKLDSVKVVETSGTEVITVIMSDFEREVLETGEEED